MNSNSIESGGERDDRLDDDDQESRQAEIEEVSTEDHLSPAVFHLDEGRWDSEPPPEIEAKLDAAAAVCEAARQAEAEVISDCAVDASSSLECEENSPGLIEGTADARATTSGSGDEPPGDEQCAGAGDDVVAVPDVPVADVGDAHASDVLADRRPLQAIAALPALSKSLKARIRSNLIWPRLSIDALPKESWRKAYRYIAERGRDNIKADEIVVEHRGRRTSRRRPTFHSYDWDLKSFFPGGDRRPWLGLGSLRELLDEPHHVRSGIRSPRIMYEALCALEALRLIEITRLRFTDGVSYGMLRGGRKDGHGAVVFPLKMLPSHDFDLAIVLKRINKLDRENRGFLLRMLSTWDSSFTDAGVASFGVYFRGKRMGMTELLHLSKLPHEVAESLRAFRREYPK
jgi:hypothetical protein